MKNLVEYVNEEFHYVGGKNVKIGQSIQFMYMEFSDNYPVEITTFEKESKLIECFSGAVMSEDIKKDVSKLNPGEFLKYNTKDVWDNTESMRDLKSRENFIFILKLK